MKRLAHLLSCFSLVLLSFSCAQAPVTVTGPTRTVTMTSQAPPITVAPTTTMTTTSTATATSIATLPTTVVVSTTLTATSTLTATTTATVTSIVTSTSTPTLTTNVFQGSLSGNWSGQTTDGPVSGIWAVAVNARGEVQGIFNGSFSGTIVGTVDLKGNLVTKGTVTGTPMDTNWTGQVALAGSSMSVQGNWTGSLGSGSFTGSGAAMK